MNVKVSVKDADAQSKLNQQQIQTFDTILGRVNSETEGLFFVEGPGGTGKTFLYRALLGMTALACASSGVAAHYCLEGARDTQDLTYHYKQMRQL